MTNESKITLADAETPLVAALTRMLALPESARPFVILQESDGERFVQFCGGSGRPGRPLMFDAPCCGTLAVIGDEQITAATALSHLKFHGVTVDRMMVLTEHHESAGQS